MLQVFSPTLSRTADVLEELYNICLSANFTHYLISQITVQIFSKPIWDVPLRVLLSLNVNQCSWLIKMCQPRKIQRNFLDVLMVCLYLNENHSRRPSNMAVLVIETGSFQAMGPMSLVIKRFLNRFTELLMMRLW